MNPVRKLSATLVEFGLSLINQCTKVPTQRKLDWGEKGWKL